MSTVKSLIIRESKLCTILTVLHGGLRLYIYLCTAEKTDGAHNRQRKKDDNPLLMTVKNTKQWCMGQREVVRKTKRAVSGESDEQ